MFYLLSQDPNTYELCRFLVTLKRFSSMDKRRFANDVLYETFQDRVCVCARVRAYVCMYMYVCVQDCVMWCPERCRL